MNVIGRLDYAEGQNFFMVANPQHQPAIEFMRFGGSIATIGKHLIFALAKTLSPPFCTRPLRRSDRQWPEQALLQNNELLYRDTCSVAGSIETIEWFMLGVS
jgi:hypothetical protein